LLLASAWIASSGAACSLFRPATPEPPSGSAIVPDYRTIDATLETMALGIEDKARTNGLTAYVGALADTNADQRAFHAFFDPLTLSRYVGTVPQDWNRALEEQKFYPSFVRLPVAAAADYAMEWNTDLSAGNDDITDATALLHRHYRVIATVADGTPDTVASGFADLYLVKSSANRWALVRWDDREDPNPPGPDALSFGQRRLESQSQ
jgi:hypothetical protein